MRTVAAGLLAALLASQAAAQNAAGAPTVSGLWAVGEALTASTGGITDPEGVSSAAFAHQWVRVAADGAETDIAGATSSAYTLAAADQGGRVKVRVSFSDDAGNPEVRTSAAYPPAASVLPEPCEVPRDPALGTEVWSATMIVGESQSASLAGEYGFRRDTDPLLTFGELSPRDFTYDGKRRTVNRLSALTPEHLLLAFNPVQYDDWFVFAFSPGSDRFGPGADGHGYAKFVLQACDHLVEFFLADAKSTGVSLVNVGVADWATRATLRVRLYDDDVAPKFNSAVGFGASIVLRFTEPLYPAGALTTAQFSVEVNGEPATVDAVAIRGVEVTLTLASELRASDTVFLEYTGSGGTRNQTLADAQNNFVLNISRTSVRVAAGPSLRSQVLAADGMTLTLTFDEDLDGASVPPAGAFTVRVGGAVRALAPVNPVAVAGRAVVLRLAEPAGAGEAVTVSYDKPAAAEP